MCRTVTLACLLILASGCLQESEQTPTSPGHEAAAAIPPTPRLKLDDIAMTTTTPVAQLRHERSWTLRYAPRSPGDPEPWEVLIESASGLPGWIWQDHWTTAEEPSMAMQTCIDTWQQTRLRVAARQLAEAASWQHLDPAVIDWRQGALASATGYLLPASALPANQLPVLSVDPAPVAADPSRSRLLERICADWRSIEATPVPHPATAPPALIQELDRITTANKQQIQAAGGSYAVHLPPTRIRMGAYHYICTITLVTQDASAAEVHAWVRNRVAPILAAGLANDQRTPQAAELAIHQTMAPAVIASWDLASGRCLGLDLTRCTIAISTLGNQTD